MTVFKAGILSLVCAITLVAMHGATRDEIRDNERHYREAALRQMVARLGDATLEPSGSDYRVTRGKVQLATIGRVHSRQGYNGDIHLWLAKDQKARVLAVRIISHKETPGIGDRVDHRVSDWLDQFEGHSSEGSNWRLRSAGGDFDGITGATVTSRAVVNAVAASLAGDDAP